MKKTVNVTLNGVIFTLEEDAFNELSEYLEKIKNHFSRAESQESGEEIISDIEASIAEKFKAKLTSRKQVINLDDVEKLIKIMGTVEDIVNGDMAKEKSLDSLEKENNEEKNDEQKPKKLYRSTDDVVIAGVCSGIAAYFGIDPLIVRLIFLASIFVGGSGVFIYIALWIIMPEATTSAQKLEMRGTSVTIKKIENLAREKAEELKKVDGSNIKRILSSFFQLISEIFKFFGRFIKKFGKAIAVILGIIIIVASVLTMTAIGFAAATLAFNLNSELMPIDFPFPEFLGGAMYQIGIVSGFLIIFIPIMFLLLLGATLVSRKSAFQAVTSSILVGIWMIAVIVFGVVLVDFWPQAENYIDKYETEYRGPVITEVYDFDNFQKIKISNAHTANITKGDEYRIVATGNEKEIEELDISLTKDVLLIKNKKINRPCIFCHLQKVDFEIVMPELLSLEQSGATKVTVQNFDGDSFVLKQEGASKSGLDIDFQEFNIDLSGASSLDLVLATSTQIDVEISGASNAKLQGETQILKLDIDGASSFNSPDLLVKDSQIELEGASRAELEVTDILNVSAEGASRLYYKGSPDLITDLSGGSKIIEK